MRGQPKSWSGTYAHAPATPMDQFVRSELERRAEYEGRPEVIAKRKADAESKERMRNERNEKRKRPTLIPCTDYPWLKPDWVEAPVRPFKRR